MKKTFRLISLFLVLFMFLTLTSCSFFEKKKKFTSGTVSENVYSSSFTGIQITLPEGWYFLTKEEIAENVSELAADMNEETFEEMTEGSFIDAYAKSSSGIDNINIAFTKGSEYTDLDASITYTILQMNDVYENWGYSPTTGEREKITLGGREFIKVITDVDIGLVTLHQYCYYAQDGDYIWSIAFTTYTDYTDTDFEAMISKAD